ncbi:hypothetical protein CAEBREN_24835 [Caenorhabditis brenneri]|uniref:Uncharacterized protein n=1 Tax=Caenorhabditis brenneri TaxID=135651 RepID=G0MH59_CAEBE|nr:hypothetical protein CAEBREN_24835 [Caenorhabditis brenneri]
MENVCSCLQLSTASSKSINALLISTVFFLNQNQKMVAVECLSIGLLTLIIVLAICWKKKSYDANKKKELENIPFEWDSITPWSPSSIVQASDENGNKESGKPESGIKHTTEENEGDKGTLIDEVRSGNA